MSWKKVDWAKYHNRHSSKSIWVIKLSFCQNDFPIGQLFWQNNSLVTYIAYWNMPIMIFSPVYFFSGHTLVVVLLICSALNCNNLCRWHDWCKLDVLWCQPIKLIQVVSNSEFHEYWWNLHFLQGLRSLKHGLLQKLSMKIFDQKFRFLIKKIGNLVP